MVTIKELSFGYKKKKQILSNINLDLKKGRIYGLLGLNGTGKTTLINQIAGLLTPDSGGCYLQGIDTRTRTPEVLAGLFIVPEQFELPKLTGDKYVELYRVFYPKFDEELFSNIILEFNIDSSLSLAELSFGQRKKFLLSFAIATRTELLLLDEPTNGLDIPSKSQFRRIIASLDIENRCIIISTHQVRDIGSMLDQVIVLKDKEVIFNESLDVISERVAVRKIDTESSEEFIYGEEVLGGQQVIVPSNGEETTNVDLELLFNGIIANTEGMNQLFEETSWKQ